MVRGAVPRVPSAGRSNAEGFRYGWQPVPAGQLRLYSGLTIGTPGIRSGRALCVRSPNWLVSDRYTMYGKPVFRRTRAVVVQPPTTQSSGFQILLASCLPLPNGRS